jgi:N-acetylneuraminate lyase
MNRFQGLIAAAHTPMHPDGSIAPEVIPLQAELHREQENVGVFVCGSTGEGHSLSREERIEIADGWSRVAGEDLPLIVHVGCNALPDARALAMHAVEIGACAISCQAPCYEKPRNVDELVGYLSAVASAAPETPFYYYDIPSFTNVHLPIVEVMQKASDCMSNLHGVKFTVVDDSSQRECIEMQGGRFEVLHGCDDRLVDGIHLGCTAAVGSTYNYAAPVYRGLFDLMEIGDEIGARCSQAQAVEMIDILLKYGVLRAGKAIMAMQGVDCGPPRLPASELDAVESSDLKSKLAELDLFPRAFF